MATASEVEIEARLKQRAAAPCAADFTISRVGCAVSPIFQHHHRSFHGTLLFMLLRCASLAVLMSIGLGGFHARSSGPTPPVAPSAAPAATAPRPQRAETLDEVLKPIHARSGLPGMALAVVDRDGLAALAVAGVRARGSEALIERDDRFHLGSCTKAMTATLVAELVARDKLRWNSTVGELLGSEVKDMHADWKSVTIDELLRHRGGAPASAERGDWAKAWACQDGPERCRAAFVASMLQRGAAQPRGTYAYSNQGYSIAARMCEVAAGAAWETLIVERLLQPLGITSAGFGPPSEATNGAAPRGHAADGTLRDIDNPSAIAPGGRLHCSMTDWARFIALHLRRAPTSDLPIDRAAFDSMHQINEKDEHSYAAGWKVASRPWGGTVLTHGGSNTVWYCVAWVAPEKEFAVLVACNQGGDAAAKQCDEAAAAAIEWWLTRPVK